MALVGAAQVFRPWGWTSALIVSEAVKQGLERAGLTGMQFREVTGPSARGSEEHERNRKLRELREQTHTAREAFWRTLGRLEEDMILPLGGGSQPARRYVWRVIHRSQGGTPLRLLERVGDEVAGDELVRERLKVESLSLEVSGSGLPGRLLTLEGQVRVVLGGESSRLPRSFTLPTGQVQLITVRVGSPRNPGSTGP